MCDYDAIRKMLSYWCEPDPCLEPGGYDDWRKRNDLDCIIASRDRRVPNDLVLNADLIFFPMGPASSHPQQCSQRAMGVVA